MSVETQNLRLEGIYPQRQKGFFMQRVKLPAGIVSCDQAAKVSELARRYARSVMHLTTRGSIELHWLTEADLLPLAQELASVGLVNRGACGGAVRGVVCGTLGATAAPGLEALARKVHRHFTGNPRFEDLPKKFKIGIEADTASGRHLIQDLGLVPTPGADGVRYDVWVAGGLGREPVPGFLLTEGLAEEGLLPLIEAVVRVYRAHTPAGKRLKHLVREIGREALRELICADHGYAEKVPLPRHLSERSVRLVESPEQRLELPVFAGELACDRLEAVLPVARELAGGVLVVNGLQNLVLHLETAELGTEARARLAGLGFLEDLPRLKVPFQVCPGSHECIMGLAPTRDLAEALLTVLGPAGQELTWALSGCPNSCAQPQLSGAGVLVSKLVLENGERTPRFDLYRMQGGPFAEPVLRDATQTELLAAVAALG